MGCISTIIGEFIWSIIFGIAITIILVLLGNNDPIHTFRVATGIVFVLAILGDLIAWGNKLNLDY